ISTKGLEVLYEGKPFTKFDCIYAKGSFRYANILGSLTKAYYNDCFMPIRNDAFTVGHNKILTHLQLQKYKIPMPTTYLSATPEAAKKILKKVNYPIVMKFPSGTQGKGVMFADSYASASSLLDALSALKQPFLIQEYVETGGVDIRAIVVGGKVVASMKRKAVIGEKRANIHAGGAGEVSELDKFTKKVAVDTCNILGANICAVDMLESTKGPVVIEINLSPGLQGITKATGVDIADKIAKYLFEQTRERVEGRKKQGTSEIFEELGIGEAVKEPEKVREIISNLDFRGNRILLPEVVTNITGFNDKDEYVIRVDKGSLSIKGSSLGKE
ncbi:RimK family alpha-L-glutamate ligase, partial [Candidatus Woesearchaeota archaeon]|nr:RimK family alpha-L-glutamate ligase [Candidatus Woesearchaeota archaeon]